MQLGDSTSGCAGRRTQKSGAVATVLLTNTERETAQPLALEP